MCSVRTANASFAVWPGAMRALTRATPFLRRQLGQRLRLRRVPELGFFYDEAIEKGDRIERILLELKQPNDDE